ncbi:MAG TPA: hypothetical protein DDY98_07380 [Ruminococcaceae bacterium]|nr:hypothetical protein [Oscillospiraceae bacterium]
MDIVKVKKTVVKAMSKIVTPAYAVGYRYNAEDTAFSLHKELAYSVIMPTASLWYADPFPFICEQKHYIFAELMKSKQKKGTIGVVCLEDGDELFREILSEPFHLSFPNVFSYGGHVYMIPESSEVRQIRLYKAEQFPYRWKLEQVLVERIAAVDTAVWAEDGKLLLETHDLETKQNRFFVCDMESLSTKEFASKENRFVNRRPGGSFAQYRSGVYHALQNCDGAYGKWLHMAKVERFTEDGLAEQELCTVKLRDISRKKTPKGQGEKAIFDRIHTFNRTDDFEVIDFRVWRLEFLNR